jgi:hypothetical protein
LGSGKAIFGERILELEFYLNQTSNFLYGFNLIPKLICIGTPPYI